MSQLLLHSPAEIMQRALVALSLGTLPSSNSAWPIYIFKDFSADASKTSGRIPDSHLVIVETAGVVQSRVFTGVKFERYGIQIKVRANDPTTARSKASTISNTLDSSIKRTEVTIDSTTYKVHSFSRTSPVIDLGEEKPKSSIYLLTINGTVAITNIT